MEHVLPNLEEVSVLVVEPAASVRMMTMEVLRSLGYKRLHGVASGKDAVSVLEVESVQWLIMPLMATEAVNALQILKLITVEPTLRKTSTTLLLDPTTEAYCLPLAFELGLLSWQPKSYVKDNLHNDFEELLKTLSAHNSNLTLTAAEYLRRLLTEKGLKKSRVALEQNLLSAYPGSPTILVNMAEAELIDGNKTRAFGLLRQAEVINQKLAPACQHLRGKYLTPADSSSGSHENVLSLKKVVVVDPDTDVLYAATEMLKQLGVNSVETFEDGQKAFEWILASGQEPDLILTEWRLPGISGPVLVQRLRQAEFIQVPIIVVSSLVKRDEKPLLIEMGVDEVIEKPFDQHLFYSVVVWAIQQNKMPTEQKSQERKFRRLLGAGKHGEAERLLAQILSDGKAGEGSKKAIQAEYAFALADYKSTCDRGVEALRLGGESLSLLNLVGKAFLKLHQYERALKCFEKANSLCSINIERLLNIAEINLQLGNVPASAKALEAASSLDQDNTLVRETQCKMDLETGNLDAASKAVDELESVPRIASYINNRAVALARSGRFEDGIVLYKRAIQCLAKKHADLAAAVTYNLGLTYARHGNYDAAISTLQAVCDSPKVPVYKKAVALLKKVKVSLKDGSSLFDEHHEIKDPSDANAAEESVDPGSKALTQEHLDDLLGKLTAKRGDLGCYLIFHCVEDVDPQAQSMLKTAVRFFPRNSIGQEKTLNQTSGSEHRNTGT